MNSKSKKRSSFSKRSIETRVKELGYVDFLKSISPFYNEEPEEPEEQEEIKQRLRLEYLEVLISLRSPKKDAIKESMHYFAGYDVEISGLLLLHCAHKAHRYKSDFIPYFIEKVESVRSTPDDKEEFKIQFLKDSSDFALKLFLKTKDNPESFVFGVDVISFLEKRIIPKQESEGESIVKKLPLKKEKEKNSFQNGFEKFGVAKKPRGIVRSINFKKAPKRTYQKIIQN